MSKKPKGPKPQGKPKGRPGGAGAGAKQKIAKAPKHKNTKPKKGGGAALQDVPLVGRGDEEIEVSDLELSDEDLEFVQKHSRRLGFLKSLDQSELDKSIREKQEKQAKQQAEERKRAAEGGSEEGDDEGDEDEGDEGADDEDAEDGAEAYERAPRRVKADKEKSAAGLPIKTLTGDLMFDKDARAAAEAARKGRRGGEPAVAMEAAVAAAAAVQVEGVTITDDMEAALVESKRKAREEAEKRAKEEKRKAAAAAKKAEESALPPALRGLNLSDLDPAERRAKLQEVMASSAQKLLALAGPDSAGAVAGELRTLQSLVADQDSMVSRLAMLSLLAVYKDILPGYRIRPPTDKEQEVKVSKDVAKLRDYEQALLKSYQTYLRSLLEGAQCVAKRTGTLSHSRVAVRCLAGLLAGLPHFNYTSDILQAVVPRMASGGAETRSMACEAVGALLAGGEGGDESGSGRAALEAVQLVADLIKRRKCCVPPEVVRTLSVLRFRDVIRAKAGEEQDEEGRRKKGKKAEKRDVKRRRKEDEVARAFKEANAGPDTAELAKQQSLMLEALFEVYFRVLKHATSVGLSGPGGSNAAATRAAVAAATDSAAAADDLPGPSSSSGDGGDVGPRVPSTSAALPWPRSKLLKKCPLLHPVLDGLAKYTHLISVDYMNDLLDVFAQLLAAPTLPLPERLRLLATTAAVLRGQGEALNVDRRDLPAATCEVEVEEEGAAGAPPSTPQSRDRLGMQVEVPAAGVGLMVVEVGVGHLLGGWWPVLVLPRGREAAAAELTGLLGPGAASAAVASTAAPAGAQEEGEESGERRAGREMLNRRMILDLGQVLDTWAAITAAQTAAAAAAAAAEVAAVAAAAAAAEAEAEALNSPLSPGGESSAGSASSNVSDGGAPGALAGPQRSASPDSPAMASAAAAAAAGGLARTSRSSVATATTTVSAAGGWGFTDAGDSFMLSSAMSSTRLTASRVSNAPGAANLAPIGERGRTGSGSASPPPEHAGGAALVPSGGRAGGAALSPAAAAGMAAAGRAAALSAAAAAAVASGPSVAMVRQSLCKTSRLLLFSVVRGLPRLTELLLDAAASLAAAAAATTPHVAPAAVGASDPALLRETLVAAGVDPQVLLPLAVLAGSTTTVDVLTCFAQEVLRAPLRLDLPQGPAGMSLLHLAALMDDGGAMSRHLIATQPWAPWAWICLSWCPPGLAENSSTPAAAAADAAAASADAEEGDAEAEAGASSGSSSSALRLTPGALSLLLGQEEPLRLAASLLSLRDGDVVAGGPEREAEMEHERRQWQRQTLATVPEDEVLGGAVGEVMEAWGRMSAAVLQALCDHLAAARV